MARHPILPLSLRMQARAMWGTRPNRDIAYQLGITDKLLALWAKRYAWGPSYYARGHAVPSGGGPRRTTRPTAPTVSQLRWRCSCGRIADTPVCACGQPGPFAA